jgi:HK97 family phage major capsid protein
MDKSMLSAARETLAAKTAEVDRIASTFKVDDAGNFTLETAQYKDYKSAVDSAKEAKGFIESFNEVQEIKSYLEAPQFPTEAAQGAGANAGVEVKSLADVFIQSQGFQAGREGGFKDVHRISGQLEGKSIFNLSAGSVTHQALGSAENLGIAERAFRQTRIRDLFPKSSTSAAVLYGVRETGWTNSAKQVRQRYAADGTSNATGGGSDVFGHKPKSNITLVPVTYPVATIAHTLDAHKNILDDEPRLRTFLNNRMSEGVKYAEDYELLYATGASEELTGLFNVSGVQSYTGVNTDKYSVQVRRAITKAMLAEYDPTGLVVSPTMWEQLEVETDNYGAFRVAVNVAVGAEKRLWRLNVANTTAMSDSKFVLGAFGLGAQLHDREAVTVTMSSENSDNFERNVVTFRAEERVALEVPRPESIVVGNWTTPA